MFFIRLGLLRIESAEFRALISFVCLCLKATEDDGRNASLAMGV